jgi:phosphatidate cytidylyltransferase
VTESDLGRRTIAGIAMIAVALAALWAGGLFFWALAAAAGLLMLAEWCGLFAADTRATKIAIAGLIVPLAIASPFAAGSGPLALALLVLCALGVALFLRNGAVGAGLVYAGLPVLALLHLRDGDQGIALAAWTLAIVWATDIGGYFAGRRIGGAKLAPRISPNKTWAGLAGGMVLAAVAGGAIAHQAGLHDAYLWLGAPLAVLAQGGDLYESWLKRRAGVKDSGTILPGHGGVLDRLDGLVPVAVAVAILALWLRP